MILILLGTFKKNFSRPLVAIEEAILAGKISEEVIVQAGHTSFKSDFLTIRTFIEIDELKELYKSASLIITHSGVGSILKGLKLNKAIIAIARLAKFNEHVDNHQLDILQEFSNRKYLFPWNEGDDFLQILEKARKFKYEPFISTQGQLVQFIDQYIENL